MHPQVKSAVKKSLINIRHKQHPPLDACRKKLFFCTSRSGFTILEVVAVLLIIGIIAAVAISRYAKTDTADLAAANTLKAHLRYAHLRAMGDTVSWGIYINKSEDSYTLQRYDDTAEVNLPGENGPEKVLKKAKITYVKETYENKYTVTFSPARGIPAETPIDITEEPEPVDNEIKIGSETITVKEFTGFIP